MVLWIDELEVWVGLESRVEGELNLRGLHMEHSHLSGAKGILWMACFLESNQRNFKDKRCLMLGVIIVLLFHDWKRTAFPRMTSFPEESLKIDVGDMCTHGMEPSLFDFHIHYGVMRAISKSLRISQDEIIKVRMEVNMNQKFSNEINESKKKLRRYKQESYAYSKHAMKAVQQAKS
ncbi:hypothetical protein VitviT2T_017292 [Vitis vinifera]|uniref:Uncharacterized protein n=1 Tax=Vitis vinifera TaxID=29760 RepID=A0ABY9CTP8_VITVI|nr:hypothetical protein VitviT2T_017292 [Vitis vinifera]